LAEVHEKGGEKTMEGGLTLEHKNNNIIAHRTFGKEQEERGNTVKSQSRRGGPSTQIREGIRTSLTNKP